MKSLNVFIKKLGVDATLKKLSSPVYNDYDELDESSSTWTEETVKILVTPMTAKSLELRSEGEKHGGVDFEAYVSSDVNVEEGDRLEYNGNKYIVTRVETTTYAGLTVKKISLTELEQ